MICGVMLRLFSTSSLPHTFFQRSYSKCACCDWSRPIAALLNKFVGGTKAHRVLSHQKANGDGRAARLARVAVNKDVGARLACRADSGETLVETGQNVGSAIILDGNKSERLDALWNSVGGLASKAQNVSDSSLLRNGGVLQFNKEVSKSEP